MTVARMNNIILCIDALVCYSNDWKGEKSIPLPGGYWKNFCLNLNTVTREKVIWCWHYIFGLGSFGNQGCAPLLT